MPDDRITSRRKPKDAVGLRFGRLVVISHFDRVPGRGNRWLCRCDCGGEKVVLRSKLGIGRVQSCGCLARESRSKNGRTLIHGQSYTPTYRAWVDIIVRCTNFGSKKYERYSGRGITVCERWRSSFKAFLEDMGERPGPGYSIDRIDNDRGYELNNCRWATSAQQARNRKGNNFIEYQGEKKCLTDWAEEIGIDPSALRRRLAVGWNLENAFKSPDELGNGPRFIEYNGDVKRLSEWAASLGMRSDTFARRLKMGWSIEKIMTTPTGKSRGNGGKRKL